LAIATERWDGMWWTRRHRARRWWQGGINSVSDRAACRRAVLKRTAKTCGPDASMVGVKSHRRRKGSTGPASQIPGDDGGEKSPILRGERVISRKAIAQGMSDVLRCPVCSCACSCARLHTRSRVQRASGIPCSLIVSRDNEIHTSGEVMPREREGVSCPSLRAQRSNPSFFARQHGLLRRKRSSQ
jgi:hypothetical protein